MEVEYVLTVEDHIAFNKYQQASQRGLQLRWSWLWLIVLVILLGLMLLPTLSSPQRERRPAVNDGRQVHPVILGDQANQEERPPEAIGGQRLDYTAWIFIIPIIIFVPLLLLGRRYLLPRQVKHLVMHPDNQRRLLGWRRTSVGPEGIAVRSEETHATIAWAAIRKIARTQQHAFFYLTTLEAIIVPRRPFANEEDFRKFLKTAHVYWEKAEGASPGAKPIRRGAAPEPDANITPDERADY